jgi:hypothetical protein
MEKLKFLGCIIACILSGFNLGMYAIVTKEHLINDWAPKGFIEPHRWAITSLVLVFFIFMSFEQAKKIDSKK